MQSGRQAAQTRLARCQQMVPRRPNVARPGAGAIRRFRGDQLALAAAGERLTEDLLSLPWRVSVSGIDEIDAGIQGDIDERAALRQHRLELVVVKPADVVRALRRVPDRNVLVDGVVGL